MSASVSGNPGGQPSTIAPGRKTDPGPGFDWSRLRAALAEQSD